MKKIIWVLVISLFMLSGCEELGQIKEDFKEGFGEAKLKGENLTIRKNPIIIVEKENKTNIKLDNEYWDILCDEYSTNLQIENTLNELKGKNITWQGEIIQIEELGVPEMGIPIYYILWIKHCSPPIIKIVNVQMKDNQKDILLKYKKEDKITYKAQIINDYLGVGWNIKAVNGEIIEE